MQRLPRGYRGINHETIGSDILALFLQVVLFPEHILAPELLARLRTVKPDKWYPISWQLEAMDSLAAKIGNSGLKQMGRQLFRASHLENVKKMASSAADIIYALQGLYLNANRGTDIGGWDVVSFKPGEAVIDKTTPHHCVMEEGLLSEAMAAIGVLTSVEQQECFRKGADACRYVLKSPVTDESWTGKKGAAPKKK